MGLRKLIWLFLSLAVILMCIVSPLAIQAQASGESIPAGDPIRGERIALSCARCHGERGISREAWIPSLAGLSQRVIYKQLDDYRSHRRRPEWYMGSIAQALSLEDSADVSAYYQGQVGGSSKRAVPGRQPPGAVSCGACHNSLTGDAPAIVGQQPQYLEIQLSLFAQGIRSNDQDSTHRKIVGQLTPDQIRQISEFFGDPPR